MKKNFLKKLSFVMALAMILSVVAPAAGAFGATTIKLNSTKKYLHLDVDGKNEYNFNITSTKGKGWKYFWESSNDDVAVVNEKNGVATATGVGTAKIILTVTDKDDEPVGEAKATVIVRDNIKEVTIANKPENDTLAIDTEFDFNRNFVTVSESKTKTSAITRWTVDPAEGATIKDNGVFKATKSGEYTVTAVSFQSKAKYDEWNAKADKSLTDALVLDYDQTKVKVNVSIKDVKLVKPTQIAITFDSSVKDTVKSIADVKVERKLTDTYSAMVPVWKFDSISEDGKVVTVSTYDNFIDKQTYKVSAAGVSFDLYAQIGAPVSISMNDQVIPAGTATTLEYTLLDQYGVNVASLFDANVAKNSTVGLAGGKLTLANNQVSFVEFSYTVFKADGTLETLSTGTKTIRGQAASVSTAIEWNIHTSEDFSKTNQKVKVGDGSMFIFGRQKKSDGNYTASASYSFESLSTNVLVIDTFTNKLVPVNAGTALVKIMDITNNNAVVGYINVEVLAKPAIQKAAVDKATVKLSNDISGTPESTTITISQYDQYETKSAATIDAAKSYVLNATRSTDVATVTIAGGVATVTAVAGKTGSFSYLLTTTDGKTATFGVTVLTPGVLSAYTIEASKDSIDAYVANSDTDSASTFKVYGVDAAGTKKIQVVSAAGITYEVKDAKGNAANVADVDLSAVGTTGAVTVSVDDTARTYEAGNWTFAITIGGIKYTKNFTVQNTRPAPALTIAALSTKVANGSGVIAAVEAMVDLKIGSNGVSVGTVDYVTTNSDIVATSANGTGVAFAKTGTVVIFVKSVTTTNGGVTQKVDINRNFTITVE